MVDLDFHLLAAAACEQLGLVSDGLDHSVAPAMHAPAPKPPGHWVSRVGAAGRSSTAGTNQRGGEDVARRESLDEPRRQIALGLAPEVKFLTWPDVVPDPAPSQRRLPADMDTMQLTGQQKHGWLDLELVIGEREDTTPQPRQPPRTHVNRPSELAGLPSLTIPGIDRSALAMLPARLAHEFQVAPAFAGSSDFASENQQADSGVGQIFADALFDPSWIHGDSHGFPWASI